MPRYTITPPDDHVAPVQYVADNPHQLLDHLKSIGWRTADIEEDDVYLCSVHSDENDVWSVSQRAHCQRYAESPPRLHWI